MLYSYIQRTTKIINRWFPSPLKKCDFTMVNLSVNNFLEFSYCNEGSIFSTIMKSAAKILHKHFRLRIFHMYHKTNSINNPEISTSSFLNKVITCLNVSYYSFLDKGLPLSSEVSWGKFFQVKELNIFTVVHIYSYVETYDIYIL